MRLADAAAALDLDGLAPAQVDAGEAFVFVADPIGSTVGTLAEPLFSAPAAPLDVRPSAPVVKPLGVSLEPNDPNAPLGFISLPAPMWANQYMPTDIGHPGFVDPIAGAAAARAADAAARGADPAAAASDQVAGHTLASPDWVDYLVYAVAALVLVFVLPRVIRVDPK